MALECTVSFKRSIRNPRQNIDEQSKSCAQNCTLIVCNNERDSQVCACLAYTLTFHAVVSFTNRTLYNHLKKIQNNLYADKFDNREGIVQFESFNQLSPNTFTFRNWAQAPPPFHAHNYCTAKITMTMTMTVTMVRFLWTCLMVSVSRSKT